MLVAGMHERWVPAELCAGSEQGLTNVGVTTAVTDIPLPAGDDLEGPLTLLVEFDRMPDCARFADECACNAEELDDAMSGLVDRVPCQMGPRLACGFTFDPWRLGALQMAVALQDDARRQPQFAPPSHIGDVAKSANHGDAGTLLRIGQSVRQDRDLGIKQRCAHRLGETAPISGIVWMGDERDARGDQLRPRGLDLKIIEANAVVCAGPLAILDLRLGDSSLKVDVPHRGRLSLIGLAALQIAEESSLRGSP